MEAGEGREVIKRGKPEILAPAGSFEALRAAIGAGADAVYMGGIRFGARAYADNPEQDALCAAIDYAHLHGRRIYLTVNTLLKQDEIKELYYYIKPYYEQGVDAVIVQDVGVLKFIADEFPGLPIHASTQMSLTMAEGAECFAGYPVTRLVNARELGLAEIQRIRRDSGLEIESFVHGALCYCYSGQCLMSSMIGGRSGNRGRCAQPCRLEYDSKYLLSPKDICTLDLVPELIEAGIDSFKIEGRMKRYEYAAGVTAAYRREVDRYFALGREGYRAFHENNPQVMRQALLELQDLYNRGGFTHGYYGGHNGREMMSLARPNHSGVLVARVEGVRGNRALLCSMEELHAQDVLEIRMGGEDAAGGQKGNHGRGDQSAVLGNRAEGRAAISGNAIGGQKGNHCHRAKSGAGRVGQAAGQQAYEFTLGQGHPVGERFEANIMPGLLVKKGNPVYRTKNGHLLCRISEEYFVKEPQIAIYGEFEAALGEPARLFVRTVPQKPDGGFAADALAQGGAGGEDGNGSFAREEENSVSPGMPSACVLGDTVQHAEKQPMGGERLRAALEKTGDTPFYFSELVIRTSGEIFLPVSALNALRRRALSQLMEEIVGRFRRGVPADGISEEAPTTKEACPPTECTDRSAVDGKAVQHPDSASAVAPTTAKEACPPIECTDRSIADGKAVQQPNRKPTNPPKIHATVMTSEQFNAALSTADVARVYYDLAALGTDGIPDASARARAAGKEFFLRLPRVCCAAAYDFLKTQKSNLLGNGISGYLAANYEQLFLLAKEWHVPGIHKHIVSDATLYTMNAHAKQFFRSLGVSEFTAPYEENAQELSALGLSDAALVVYGRIPLMLSAQCVYKNTADCRIKQGQAGGIGTFLTDRKGKKLPVFAACRFCYNIIYSAETLALFPCSELEKLSPFAVRYDFTDETGREVEEILGRGHFPEGREKTLGHFRRGVL